MSSIQKSREALAARILDGEGKASHAQRRQAFENTGVEAPLATLVDEVVRRAHEVGDADIDGARTAGFSVGQIFEIVICAIAGAPRVLAAFRPRVDRVTVALSQSRCTHASLRAGTGMEAEKSQTVRCDEPAGE